MRSRGYSPYAGVVPIPQMELLALALILGHLLPKRQQEWTWTMGPSRRVKTWRFEPATRNGQRVTVEMPIEVSSNLH
jgi:hypothetical protein